MALLSLLARLGSSAPVELCADLDTLAQGFDIVSFGAAPTRFNPDDLLPLTAKALHALSHEAVAAELAALGVPEAQVPAFWAAVAGNLETRADIAAWWRICQGEVQPEIAAEDAEFVAEAMTLLPPRPWDETTWKAWTDRVKAQTGRKGRGLFLPLRKALTGRAHGPDMSALMPLLSGARP